MNSLYHPFFYTKHLTHTHTFYLLNIDCKIIENITMTTRKGWETTKFVRCCIYREKNLQKYTLYIYTMCRFWNDEKISFLDCPLYNPLKFIIFIIPDTPQTHMYSCERFVTLHIAFISEKRQFQCIIAV